MANVCGLFTVWPSRLRRARLFPRRWPGNPFGQGEVFMIFVLTKILSGKQLLREDNLHAISRRLFGFGQSGLEIRGGAHGGSGLD